jgi:exopolyphosphatase/guanosine-5'-triphosphate,3'-diphosphate pyrophosphatase
VSIVKDDVGSRDRIIAAFDLGSNTIKMTVARRSNASVSNIEEFLWRSETVRLGSGIDKTGELAPDRIDAALDALTRFSAEARDAGATRLLGVATEATRIARNGEAFLGRVADETGIEIQSVTGDREASLTFLGLNGVVDLSGVVVVADIGGGSTEIIIAKSEKIQWAQSFALGSGRLTDRHVHHDPPTVEEIADAGAEAGEILSAAPVAQARGGRLIVVGGTGEYLDRLIPEDAPRDPHALDEVLERLTTIPSAQLSSSLMIPEARARVLPAGVAIARSVAELMQPASFEAASSGIRRGLLLAAFAGEI